MVRHVKIILVVLTLALAIQGCESVRDLGDEDIKGSGNVVEEERPVSGLSGVHLEGPGTVIIEFGSPEALVIEAEDNLLEYFKTEVRNDTLWIEQQDGFNLRPSKPINFFVTAQTLDAVAVSGSGQITCPPVSTGQFSLDVSGSGAIQIEDLDADSLDVTIDGSGEASVAAGAVQSQDVKISGSGKYDAQNMRSNTTDVRIDGSGGATVWVTDQLVVDISGSGEVRYAGDPSVSQNVRGSGGVERIGD